MAPEVLDDEHKVDLQQLHKDWPKFMSAYIEMWENQLNAWSSSTPFLITLSGSSIYRQPSHEGLHEVLSGSSYFYQFPLPYGIQTPPPWVMQTPPHSLFYQGGSSSQHPKPDPLPEEPES
ncbi:hypothetical protein J1N35_043429 [Gossypium stocksii]|uniref:Uncharacterized protein n=1 Tax=Gossypium stocksii TaxID=47602 RepID=A0A9D3U784_9ROSI|nr:hypothetical protein J1N35_043429 [Gossypium stocksii]